MTGSGGRGFLTAMALAALLLLLLQAALRSDPERRSLEYFPDMVYSPAGESFDPSDALPDGRVLQPLPEGVVVRGRRPFPYGPGEQEAIRAGGELRNPFNPGDAAALERGAEVFGIFCEICHDARGEGRGPVVLRGMVPPPAFQGVSTRSMPDGRIFHLLTRGRGNMASYAAQLSPEDRWKVILHVRSLQGGP